MSAQIEILEIVLLFTAILLFTFGIVGLRFSLTNKLYFNFTFIGVLVLSFISLQAAIFTYIMKFDIYYGWNAALLILVLAAIISSPFILRMINSARLFNFSKLPVRKPIQPLEEKNDEKPKFADEEKQIETPVFAEGPKLTEEPIQIKSEMDVQPVKIAPEPVKPGEDLVSEVIPAEKDIKETAPKRKTASKRTPVKKTPAKKPAAKTKPRGKK